MKINFKSLSAMAFCALFIFGSCSEDAVDFGEKQNTDTQTFQLAMRGGSMIAVTSLQDFAYNHVLLVDELGQLLDDANPTYPIDLAGSLSNAADETALLKVLEDAGISNTTDYINLVNDMKFNYSELENNVSTFASMSSAQKSEAVLGALNEAWTLQFPPDPDFPIEVDKRTCKQQLNKELDRCRRNLALECGVALVSGWMSGGLTALIGYGVAGLIYQYCEEDAIEDYVDCQKP